MRTIGGAALIAVAITAATPLRAQEEAAPRLRPVDTATAHLLTDLLSRSATARGLVAVLERSNLIVYIRFRWFPTAALRGRIGFLPPGSERRVAIEIASRDTYVERLVALGHELQHATEIAADPAATDARSLAALYQRIGEALGEIAGSAEAFETQAAADAGTRVRNEISRADSAATADADR